MSASAADATVQKRITRADILVQILGEREARDEDTVRIDFLNSGGFVFHDGSGREAEYDPYGNIIMLRGGGCALDDDSDGW